MRVLVTGGAGFIGSVTVEALIERGHDVTVLDNLSKGHREAVDPRARFFEADLSDEPTLRRILTDEDIEAVVHFAAFIEVGESMSEPLRYFRNNTAVTLSLLTAMLGVGVRKFVFSSTAALFGNPVTVPIPEDARVQPESVYGESKRMVEQMLMWLSRTAGLGFAALRYFNACGATETHGEDHHPETHLIPLVLQVAQGKRERIHIFGEDYDTPDGSAVRDYIHVRDLAEAHLLALESLREGEARSYNLGNGQGYSVKQVIEACRGVTGHSIPAVVAERRAGDPAVLVADPTRIRRELGWEPRSPELSAMVGSAWEWRQTHPNGYRS